MPLTDEERQICMRIESLLPRCKEHASIHLQENTIEGFWLKANSFSTKELAFELISDIMKVEKLIFAPYEDEDEVLANKDEWPNQSSWTSPKSLARL